LGISSNKLLIGGNMERFVAFLDVLGFSQYVENNDYERVLNALKDLKQFVIYANRIPAIPEFPIIEGELVHHIIFSDSIVLYTDGKEISDFFRIVHVVKLLIRASLASPTPLRGAISYGEFFAEDNIFFGKSYIDACKSESKQLWAGAFICDKAIHHINTISKDNFFEILINTAYIIEYSIPFKENHLKPKYNYAINWANSIFNEDLDRKLFHGYPFIETIINDKVQQMPQDTEPDALVNIDLSALKDKDKILSIINNTRDFYQFAIDKGKIPYSELPL